MRNMMIVAVLSAVLAWNINTVRYEGKISQLRAEQAEALSLAHARARQKEREWATKIEEVKSEAREEIGRLERDIDDAERMHSELADAARRAAESAASSCRSETAPAPSVVCADLLESVDRRAGQLAEEADRRRVAGAACEAAYDILL